MNEMQKTPDIVYENELYIYILLHRTLSNDVTTMFPPCYILPHYVQLQESTCKL